MEPKNFAIGVLSTTAVILFVGLMIINTRPQPALASGVTAAGGGYVLTVGSVSINDQELLFVIETSTEKLIIYGFDPGRGKIEIVDRINLAEMRKATSGAAPAAKKKPSGRRRP